MLANFRKIAFVLLAFVSGVASADTLYTYSGPAYTTATGLYTTAMKISGYFRTAVPLPPNLTNVPIGPGAASNLVSGWSFTDGVSTYTNANSMLLYGQATRFAVSTDASGNITAFSVGFMSPLGSHTVGQLMNAVYLSSSLHEAGTSIPCGAAASNVCITLPTGGTNFARANSPGTWTKSDSAANPVPALGEWGLLVLAGLLILAAGFKMRPRTV